MPVSPAALVDDLRPKKRKNPEFPAPSFLEDTRQRLTDNRENIFSGAGGQPETALSPQSLGRCHIGAAP
jgi:hypothetical protein